MLRVRRELSSRRYVEKNDINKCTFVGIEIYIIQLQTNYARTERIYVNSRI